MCKREWVNLNLQCGPEYLYLCFWQKCIFSLSTHIRLCLIYVKNEVIPVLFCYVLKFKWLLEKASNWCFHYVMIHLDKTPNQAIWNKFLSIAICSNVISVCVIRRLKISVNSEFLVWIHEIMPVKAQSNICNKLPNKSRESRSVTFLLLLV